MSSCANCTERYTYRYNRFVMNAAYFVLRRIQSYRLNYVQMFSNIWNNDPGFRSMYVWGQSNIERTYACMYVHWNRSAFSYTFVSTGAVCVIRGRKVWQGQKWLSTCHRLAVSFINCSHSEILYCATIQVHVHLLGRNWHAQTHPKCFFTHWLVWSSVVAIAKRTKWIFEQKALGPRATTV